MTYVDGDNLSKIGEFKNTTFLNTLIRVPLLIRQAYGLKLLSSLSSVWGEQIFVLKMFNGDPHPGFF
jgi:hypothetical protein